MSDNKKIFHLMHKKVKKKEVMINTLKPLHNKGTLGHDEVSFKVPKNYDISNSKTVWN